MKTMNHELPGYLFFDDGILFIKTESGAEYPIEEEPVRFLFTIEDDSSEDIYMARKDGVVITVSITEDFYSGE